MKTQLLGWILFLAIAPGLSAQSSGLQATAAGPFIRLKTRTVGPGMDGRGFHTGDRLPTGRGHYVFQFQELPGPSVHRELARRGARVLEYVPDNALMVALPDGFQGSGLGVVRWFSLAAADKLSPLLSGNYGYYVVIFEPDVDMADAQSWVESFAFQVLPNPSLLPAQLLIAGDSSRLATLAGWDEVSYIIPASNELVSGAPVMACAGALTEAGPVGAYVLVSSGWPSDANGVASLSYVFGALTSQLDAASVENAIQSALETWERSANISLSPGAQADAARTILIEFVSGDHGDGYPFTSSSMLAHTFYPAPPNAEPVAGDMHLNADEPWNIGSGIDIFSVALHEAGHALGLGHSDQPGAVMYPYYHAAGGLTGDDIAGIQALYGPPGSSPAPSNPPVTNPPTSNPPASNPPPSNPPVSNPPVSNPPAPGGGTAVPTLTIVSPAATMVSTSASSQIFSGTA